MEEFFSIQLSDALSSSTYSCGAISLSPPAFLSPMEAAPSSPAASASPDLSSPWAGGSSQSAATRERGSASASQEVEGSIRREHQQIHRRPRKVWGGDYNTGENVLCHRTPHHPIIRILARQQTRKEEGAKRRLFIAEVETGGNNLALAVVAAHYPVAVGERDRGELLVFLVVSL